MHPIYNTYTEKLGILFVTKKFAVERLEYKEQKGR